MRKTHWIAAAVLVLALAGALYVSVTGVPTGKGSDEAGSPVDGVSPGPERGAPLPGRQAPPFALSDISGNVVPSSRFTGKPTVVNFFATWCPPCREEIPAFVEVYNRYRGRGLELVGISLDTDTRRNLPGFIAANGIEYRILLGDIATVRAYGGVSSLPTTFFIGKDGVVKQVHIGLIDEATLEREVRNLL